jgi:hypothetical protein
MRAPPPVEYRSTPGRAWRGALSLLVGAAVAVPIAWALPYVASQAGSREPGVVLAALAQPALQATLALGFGLAAGAAFWLWHRRAPGGEHTLRWDGQDWVLAGDRLDRRGDVALMLDLGPWMLVRFLPFGGGGSSAWLPLTLGRDVARWAALRGALWNWRAGREGARP